MKHNINSREKITLCYGTFDMLHPGHFRILNYAKGLCSKLIIILNKGDENTKHSGEERKKMVSSLNIADQVILLKNKTLIDHVEIIKPFYFLVGREFRDVRNDEILGIENILNKNSGQIRFFDNQNFEIEISDSIDQAENFIDFELLKKCKLDLNLEKDVLISIFKKISLLNIGVIGDIILDKYVQSVPLGVSSEAPVLVVNEVDETSYAGGAAIVAKHISTLGAKTNLISISGFDIEAKKIQQELKNANVFSLIIADKERPTTLKTRYLVDHQKIFRVSRLVDIPINNKIEKKIINKLENLIYETDWIIFSDFSYGLFSKSFIKNLREKFQNFYHCMSGDSQTGSQQGDLKKFSKFHCIFPTEKEARTQLLDNHSTIETIGWKLQKELDNQHIFLKMGREGLIVFSKNNKEKIYCPAFAKKVVDVSGAGDALLAISSVALSLNNNPRYAAFLGSLASAFAINNLGNIPVDKNKILKVLKEKL